MSAISPRTLRAGSSQQIALTGSGLNRGTTVDLGPDTTVTAVQSSTSGSLSGTLAVAAGAVGGVRDIVVKNPDGQTSTCVGCFTLTGTTSPSPSPVLPSPSRSASPSPSPSASPSASPSPSPPPPSPSPPAPVPSPAAPTVAPPTVAPPAEPSAAPPTMTLSPATSRAGAKVTVSGKAEPGDTVELWAYTRPSTTYGLARTAEVAEDGTYAFTVAPSRNTRMFVKDTTEDTQSPSAVLRVMTSINVKVARTGVRTYRFTGSTLPKRPGQTVNVYYLAGTKKTIAGKAVVTPKGTYLFERRFGSGGTLTFTAQTGVDNDNAAGTSAPVKVALK